MSRLITMRDGKVVKDQEIPDPVTNDAKVDVDAEIRELKARITALEAQVEADRAKG